uniref:G-protein coupled receptors family 3 profile domain-containing protein n=1 Tax=Globisporangium ultimum (strain ATCC 200006 / CBS 805.95 / DAOM BR144) TaxID=431595 RepID=K3WYN7_GLOUD
MALFRSVLGVSIAVWSCLAAVITAADVFPSNIGYTCKSAKCVYNAGNYASSEYKDGLSCMKECGQSEIQSIDSTLNDTPGMTISSSLKGTCTNCSLVIETSWNFPEMFDTYDLTEESLSSSSCNFTSTMEINSPPLWVLEDSVSNCYINDAKVDCIRDGNKTLVSLNASMLVVLMEPEKQYVFSVDHFSTRLGPGTKTEVTVMNVKFDGTGCRATTEDTSSPRQVFNLELTSTSYKLIGMFTDTEMDAVDPRVMSTTSVSLSFRSGAVLRAGAFILLRVAKGLEDYFSTLIRNVSDASMQYAGQRVALDLYVGASNISFTIPDSFTGDIGNGDRLNITFNNFKTPSNDSMTIEKCYLSAYQGLALAVDNSPVPFYHIRRATRELNASNLDIATVVIFGLCFLFSLVIIRWHGLPLTMTTLWTDMVAISALFSFASGCGGFLVWVIQPSKAYVHWYTAQYFFNTMMILSLCFHWASVLSFKSFKKLSIKSPAVIGYIVANAAVLALIIALSIAADSDLKCVFDIESTQCSTQEQCSESLAAEGKVVRNAVQLCDIQSFYLAFGAGFIMCTLMLMILGCMVMSRGRSLMLNEDPSEPRIRSSLTIFYAIIATTCVLYISAQVIYIAQYASDSSDSGELSDLVWYIFIIWLPHGLPPLLLLFLQWNPSTENFHHDEPESIIDQSSKEDVFNITPRSSGSSPHMPYSKLLRDRISMGESMINGDEPGNKLRLIVRLKLPANFDRACFVSLDYFSSKEPVSGSSSLASITRKAQWKCVGTTEPVGMVGETESALSSGVSNAIFPFVAVLEVPVVGHASNTLLRFLVHASTIGKRDTGHNFAANYLDGHTGSFENSGSGSKNETPATQLSYQMTMFHPLLEFVTSSQAVLDAAASGQPLNVHPTDEHTCTILEDHPSLQREVDVLLQGNMNNAELSVQTVMMPGEAPTKEDVSSHKNIGNIIRFFQYDTEDGGGGL